MKEQEGDVLVQVAGKWQKVVDVSNRKLDPALGEKIHGEFFHTTPGDEAATALKNAVKLEPSHGCIQHAR